LGLNDNFFYYNKFVQFNDDDAKIIAVPIINHFKDKKLNVFEVGTGYGSVSIPIIKYLTDEKKLNKWYGIEVDKDKIEQFFKLYDYYKKIKAKIKDNRTKLFSDYKENYGQPTNNAKGSNIEIKSFDIEQIDNFKGLNNKFFDNNKIDVLFIPFIFQHVNKWRYFLRHLFDKNIFSDNLIVVSGELSGDWETMFSPWQATQYIDEENLKWKETFSKIWEKLSIINSSLRDYRYQNILVFNYFLENRCNFHSDKIEIREIDFNVKTSIEEVLNHFKDRTWSCIFQNLESINFNKKEMEKLFTENKLREDMNFHSIHKFNYFFKIRGFK